MRRALGSLVLAAALVSGSSTVFAAEHHQDAFMPDNPNENRLIQEVRHQLLMLPYYTIFDDLGFRVNGGTVTLEGQVTNPVLKNDAENAAKHAEGVSNVVNTIEVLPLSPMDDQIRRAELRAIYGNPQIGDRYGYQALPPIHIIVKNGHVTLEGVVASTFDKEFINTKANEVPNVFSVANDLVVEGKK